MFNTCDKNNYFTFFFNKAPYFAVTRGNKSNNSASLDSHATDNNRDNRLSKPRFKTDTKV